MSSTVVHYPTVPATAPATAPRFRGANATRPEAGDGFYRREAANAGYLADHSARRYRARLQSIFQTIRARRRLYAVNPSWPFLIVAVCSAQRFAAPP
jgi:hypothetical protein